MTFFWKKKDGYYHWHLNCAQIPIQVRGNPDWEVSEQRPVGRDQCLSCREKDLALRLKRSH